MSPSLIESYVSAAMKISRRAVGDRTLTPTQITYPAPGGLVQDKHIEGLPLGTRGGLLVHHTFPLDAEYEFSVSGGFGGPGGGGGGATTDVTLDGEQLKPANVRSFRIPVTAGPHTIGASLVDRTRAAGVDEQVFRLPRQFDVRRRRWRPDGRHHRSIQGHEHRRHAEPSPDLRLSAGERRRRTSVREEDRLDDWRAAPIAVRSRMMKSRR